MVTTNRESSTRARRSALLCALALTACGALPAHQPVAPHADARANPSAHTNWQAPPGTHAVVSNDGAWRIVYRTEPEPPERGAPFSVEAWVCATSAPDRLRADVALRIDAAMPQHQHGMNRVPAISPSDSGGFRAQGLLFHMAGSWELFFDVTEGAITERAQVKLEVE